MTTLAVVQARYASTRLPGKALYPLEGKPVLVHLLERLGACETLDRVKVATTTLPEDVALLRWAEEGGYGWLTHDQPDDVMTRFVWATEGLADTDVLVRLTGDNPLVCADLVDACVRLVVRGAHDYARTSERIPEGLDVEAFTVALLRAADEAFPAGYDPLPREHLAAAFALVAERPGFVEPEDGGDYGRVRLTLDVPEDYPVLTAVAHQLRHLEPRLRHVLRLLRAKPHLFLGNQDVARNEWKSQQGGVEG